MTIFITEKKQVKRFCPGLNNFYPDKNVAVSSKCTRKTNALFIGQCAPPGECSYDANTWAPRHDDVRRKHGLRDEVIRLRHLDRHVADHASGEQES